MDFKICSKLVKKRLGRTYRIRNKLRLKEVNKYDGEELMLECDLKKFLFSKGLKRDKFIPTLQLFNFFETGRGLKTKYHIAENSVLIKIPGMAIISCQRIIEDKDLGSLISSCTEKFHLVDIFVLFLLYHKNLKHTQWQEYLRSLPNSYSTLYFCSENEIKILPDYFFTIANEFQRKVRSCFHTLDRIWKKLHLLGKVSSSLIMSEIEWAWFTVNTRCVYLDGPNFSFLKDDNKFVMIPYLDMLNHSCDAETVAEYSVQNNAFEIRTLIGYKAHDQVFINYGPHNNFKLLTEYGFVIINNPHDYIKITINDIILALNCSCIPENRSDHVKKKRTIVEDNFASQLSINWEGPSWNLEVSCTIFVMTEKEIMNWKQIYINLRDLPSYIYGLQVLLVIVKNKLKYLEKFLNTSNEFSNVSDSFLMAKLFLLEQCNIAKNYLKSYSNT
ncbi:UNVERIFIED_CONTAM: hypothetical protein RMT77_012103 [Armadillidium vulgare]